MLVQAMIAKSIVLCFLYAVVLCRLYAYTNRLFNRTMVA